MNNFRYSINNWNSSYKWVSVYFNTITPYLVQFIVISHQHDLCVAEIN